MVTFDIVAKGDVAAEPNDDRHGEDDGDEDEHLLARSGISTS